MVLGSYLSGKFRKKRRDGGQNVVGPRPTFLLVGLVETKTGLDNKMLSILVLAKDGRTAPLPTLSTIIRV